MSDEQIFDIVHTQIAALIGERGSWIVERRTAESGDGIFHSLLARSVSVQLTEALSTAREALTGQDAAPGLSRVETGPVATTPVTAPSEQEPAAFGWSPEPIARWTEVEPARSDAREGSESAEIREGSTSSESADEHPARSTKLVA
ncbi:hypothetical protein [Compostimonas suwonensis]|uniref:hypothetical protein n=1 Tax=Compostimonas suwonensis TaxID=1048394 RepID=UPI001B804779|nr:hypothetical protein [Compostimonas suwonensis]